MGVQTDNGKAFEYAVLVSFKDALLKDNLKVDIVNSPALETARAKYEDSISEPERRIMNLAAHASVKTIRKFEPNLQEAEENVMLEIMNDRTGVIGDVSDVVIRKQSTNWRCGISCKHNHAALKHSRLSSTIDFGLEWMGHPCSENYWKAIRPQFNKYRKMIEGLPRSQRPTWNTIASTTEEKARLVYLPILNAFQEELRRLDQEHEDVPKNLVEYLLGRKDFYKVIARDSEHRTDIQAFNIHDTLSKTYKSITASPRAVPLSNKLPTRILDMTLNDAGTTLVVTFNEGWALSFRLHNASSKIEPSLKFDIQMIGTPSALTSLSSYWE